jgi:hypothetical protein
MEYRDVQYTLEEDGLGGWQWAVVLGSPREVEYGHAVRKGKYNTADACHRGLNSNSSQTGPPLMVGGEFHHVRMRSVVLIRTLVLTN